MGFPQGTKGEKGVEAQICGIEIENKLLKTRTKTMVTGISTELARIKLTTPSPTKVGIDLAMVK